MMLRGSAKTDTILTSVARTSPLRSTMSGRAAEISDDVDAAHLARCLARDRKIDEPAADHAEQAREAERRETDARRALVDAQAEELAQRCPRTPRFGGAALAAGSSVCGLVRSRASPFRGLGRRGAGVAGLVLRRRCRLEQVRAPRACGRSRPHARGRFGRSDRRASCWIFMRLQIEVLVRGRLQAIGTVEILPFGLQHGDGVALALHLAISASPPARRR